MATGACEICMVVRVSKGKRPPLFEHACPCGVSHHICWSCIQQFRLEPGEPLPSCPQSDEFKVAAAVMLKENPGLSPKMAELDRSLREMLRGLRQQGLM